MISSLFGSSRRRLSAKRLIIMREKEMREALEIKDNAIYVVYVYLHRVSGSSDVSFSTSYNYKTNFKPCVSSYNLDHSCST